MTKRNILILSVVGIVCIIGGILITRAEASGGGTTGFGAIVYILGLIISAVAWIMGIVKTAVTRHWGWLIAVVILGTLGSLIYGLAGPDDTAHPYYRQPLAR